MDTIVAILRAAHCKSTHHYFAIDALHEVPSARGKALANLLLANYSDYLKGAKDPDNVFKDFENHVLHVRDGYWGGAAKTAEKWLDRIYKLLSTGNWKEAAYAIGVLSHYFTDPFMPLHTAQSPRETIVHRPLEWSVCCSYQSIFKIAGEDSSFESFPIGSNNDWLSDAILRGATLSNRFYEPLMDDYDLNESSRHPELALGASSKQTLAMIFTWVLTGWGGVVDRIANESDIQIPTSYLAIPTLLAGVQLPLKRIVAAIESVEQRKEVEKILDEFNRTGNVVRNVTPEQRTVQRVRKERPEIRPEPMAIQRAVSNFALQAPLAQVAPTTLAAAAARTNHVIQQSVLPLERNKQDESQRNPVLEKLDVETPKTDPSIVETSSGRVQFTTDSPIVDAPAIGPKTAARFEAIGLKTVHDLLSHDAQRIAEKLNTQWITDRLVTQWQDQARLACQIERLTAAGSGLLVLAGIRTADDLARRKPEDALAVIHEAAQSTEGKRLLRDQEPPPLKTVQRWIESAGSAKSAA